MPPSEIDAGSRPEPLSSNALNYLVWRYLQERGFAMAATWLGREWHQEPDLMMPFAKHVKKDQLVHMIQDSLFIDHIRAREDRSKHRYFFGDDHGPDAAQPVYDISGYHKRNDSRRPEQHLLTNGASDDPLIRRIKRRKSRMRRVNGDAMDLDDASAQSDQVSDMDSPAPAVQDVPLLDNLAITEDRSVSTEKPRDLLPNTIYLDWPEEQLISHSIWSTTESGPLLIGGTNTLRLYGVRKSGQEALHRTIETDFKDYDVEAMCWLGPSQAAASVVAKSTNRTIGEESRQLIYLSHWGQEGSQILEHDTGIVFALRFNKDSNLLLALAQNTTTTISIVRISDNTATHLCLKEFTQYNLFDAAWMTPTKFIACGTDTLQLFEIVSHSDSTYEIRLIQSHDMQRSWYRIKYDPVSQIAALVDQDYTLLRQYNVATEDTKTQAFTDSRISDFAFQPIPNPDSYDPTTTPRLLATSTKDGTIQLWDVLNPITCVHRLSLPAYGNTITMEQISFSPDGYLLAGAGYDTVAVWRPEEGGQPKAVWRCTDSDTWRSEPPETDKEGEDGWVHTLDWDAHGQRLAFTLHNQAAVIRFS